MVLSAHVYLSSSNLAIFAPHLVLVHACRTFVVTSSESLIPQNGAFLPGQCLRIHPAPVLVKRQEERDPPSNQRRMGDVEKCGLRLTLRLVTVHARPTFSCVLNHSCKYLLVYLENFIPPCGVYLCPSIVYLSRQELYRYQHRER
ncbi:hypothetical protein C8Q77DRAFT_1135607 [Trametes polyzona]|nr:hypothetical protein C8Q77DRAFT_1135607 [Trametes polyzona]